MYVTLRLADSGLPLTGHHERRIELDDEGRGRLEQLPATKYRVLLTTTPAAGPRRFEIPQRQDITIPEHGVLPMDIELKVGGRVEVSVKDDAGAMQAPESLAIEGAHAIYFVPLDSKLGFTIWPLRQAVPHITLTPVLPGRYDVIGRAKNEVYARAESIVEAGKVTKIVLKR